MNFGPCFDLWKLLYSQNPKPTSPFIRWVREERPRCYLEPAGFGRSCKRRWKPPFWRWTTCRTSTRATPPWREVPTKKPTSTWRSYRPSSRARASSNDTVSSTTSSPRSSRAASTPSLSSPKRSTKQTLISDASGVSKFEAFPPWVHKALVFNFVWNLFAQLGLSVLGFWMLGN